MASISIKLNRNRRNKIGEASIFFQIVNNRKNSSIVTGLHVKDEYFLGEPQKVLRSNAPNAEALNKELWNLYLKFQEKLLSLNTTGRSKKMTVVEVKKYLLSDEDVFSLNNSVVTFTDYAQKHLQRYTGQSYNTNKRMIAMVTDFFKGKTIFFEDITVGALRNMDDLWGKTMAINSRAIYFRNLRALFNRAIDDGVCKEYPFRSFKIKSVNKEKDFLPVEYMRKLRNLNFLETENLRELTRDAFLLSFYLCGVILDDIYIWKPENLVDGKIIFVRDKIARHEPNKIKITVPPEAMEIIKKYKGKNYLLNFAEVYPNYENFIGYITHRIKDIAKRIGYPSLTFYYARYSWATYADKLGIDEKVISKSLGHTDKSVAGRHYISYDWKRTDEANRKVIDYLCASY
ncbi:MAG: site-specific integrase [Bacteroidales bacterium]|nr:site-specific integrase [Bacteroidales bacterium]